MKRLLFGTMAVSLMVVGVACKSSTSSTPAAASGGQSAPAGMTSMMGSGSIPGQTMMNMPAFPTYYDAHKDIVTVTDAYPKADATKLNVNYAPALAAVSAASQPLWYLIQGPAAPGQIAVLGSEPGESNYSPLWRTVNVRWNSGVTPTLLTSDAMIDSLAKKGQLTEQTTSSIVNATVLSVGK